MDVEEVKTHALALCLEDRAALIEELLSSFSPVLREEIDAAWAEEAEKRLKHHETHPEQAISWEESVRRIRER